MDKGMTPAEYDLLREIISRRDGSALTLLDALWERRMTEDERERLRGLVADELVERGLEDDDEPTGYGLQLERLVDALGYQ